MKRLALLKTLVTIAFILCMIIVFFGLPFILIVATAPQHVPEPFTKRESAALFYSVFYIAHLAFTYALFQFKKTLELFYKKIYFDTRVIDGLNATGKSFIAAAVLLVVLDFIYSLIVEGKFEMGVEISLESPLFIFGLGLFFLVLAEVFTNARQLKEENDLTV